MLYKPNYCCSCGEKIERIEWNLLTSRRFCPVCAEANKNHDMMPRVLVGVGVLGVAFGFGSMFSGGLDRPVQPMQSAVGFRTSQPDSRPNEPKRSEPAATVADPVSTQALPVVSQQQPDVAIAGEQAKNATRYYCDALTKKGTPCSRKVKAAGVRCFQHEGKPAARREN